MFEMILAGLIVAGLSGAMGYSMGLKRFVTNHRKNKGGKVDLTRACISIGAAVEAKQPGLPKKLRERFR
ncbi:MAG: hypothetical protein ACOY9Y_02315 [Bacillota bacterium]